jgi:hypothetical protein
MAAEIPERMREAQAAEATVPPAPAAEAPPVMDA